HLREPLALPRFRRRPRLRLGPAWRQPLAIAGATIAVAWFLIAIFAPLVAPYDPLAQSFTPTQAPTGAHLFGTDELGRDGLRRVIYGARITIPIPLLLLRPAAAT